MRAGVPLRLAFRVSQVSGGACAPLSGAVVDVWQCDAAGVYSDVRDGGSNTTGKKFLRGYQVTDANGVAQFTAIYPGWYAGRAVHVHFKIRTGGPATSGAGAGAAGAGAGAPREFTSQLYFDDALTDKVHAQAPYATKRGSRHKNDADAIYRVGGRELLLNAVPDGQGYAATFDIGLQLT